jgi:hypothetical protein
MDGKEVLQSHSSINELYFVATIIDLIVAMISN